MSTVTREGEVSSPDGRIYVWDRGGVDDPGPLAGHGSAQIAFCDNTSTLVRIIFDWHLWTNDLNDYFLDDFQRIVSALVYVQGDPPPAPLDVTDPSFYEQEFLHLSHHLAGTIYPFTSADVHGIVPREAPGHIDVAVNRRPPLGETGEVWWVWGTTVFNSPIFLSAWTRSVLLLNPPPP